MERASWSYQLPPAGAPDTGLEQYQVYVPSGEVWKTAAVLEKDGEVYLAAAPSGFPVGHRLVAIPWSAVERVDHEALAVHVGDLGGALELDPDRATENGDGEARRLTELPPELRRPQPPGGEAGPTDRLRLVLGISAAALGFVALLGAIALVDTMEEGWRYALLAVPAVFFAAAFVLSVSAWRHPYEAGPRPSGSSLEARRPPR
ncbi:MAG TPA: hypothetical protein VK915_04055 [Gaiellaceae bacterium]|nr:hypothetical protein [Gaiellaceae bacterium]